MRCTNRMFGPFFLWLKVYVITMQSIFSLLLCNQNVISLTWCSILFHSLSCINDHRRSLWSWRAISRLNMALYYAICYSLLEPSTKFNKTWAREFSKNPKEENRQEVLSQKEIHKKTLFKKTPLTSILKKKLYNQDPNWLSCYMKDQHRCVRMTQIQHSGSVRASAARFRLT